MITQLKEQIYAAKNCGLELEAAEVGPKTWEELIGIIEAQNRFPTPPETSMIKEFRFMGVRVRPNRTVPEGRLWPLE